MNYVIRPQETGAAILPHLSPSSLRGSKRRAGAVASVPVPGMKVLPGIAREALLHTRGMGGVLAVPAAVPIPLSKELKLVAKLDFKAAIVRLIVLTAV